MLLMVLLVVIEKGASFWSNNLQGVTLPPPEALSRFYYNSQTALALTLVPVLVLTLVLVLALALVRLLMLSLLPSGYWT